MSCDDVASSVLSQLHEKRTGACVVSWLKIDEPMNIYEVQMPQCQQLSKLHIILCDLQYIIYIYIQIEVRYAYDRQCIVAASCRFKGSKSASFFLHVMLDAAVPTLTCPGFLLHFVAFSRLSLKIVWSFWIVQTSTLSWKLGFSTDFFW